MVVLLLVAEGRLSLEDTVERHLPGVVRGNGNDGGSIRIRHLLQNTSGIQDDLPGYTSAAEYRRRRNDVWSPEQLVARAVGHRPAFAPGQGWAYSNTGFVVVGRIIERITGRGWPDEVHERILRPLALTRTTWAGTSAILPTPHARAYQQFPGEAELVDVTDQVEVVPGLISTTADLARFFLALMDGTLLPPAALAQMRRTVPVSADVEPIWPGGRYGLGLVERPLSCGGTFWGHDGGDGGYITANGVTGDGTRCVVVSASTALGASAESVLRQQRALDTMVDNALSEPDDDAV